MARYAYDIAAVVEKLGRDCLSKKVLEVKDTVKGMVTTAVEMFLAGDASRLGELERLDDEVVDKAYERSLDSFSRGRISARRSTRWCCDCSRGHRITPYI